MTGEGLPTANHVRRMPRGPATAALSDDEHADLCMLYWRLPAERQREFWQLRGSREQKQVFLLRYGHFEQWRRTS